MPFQRQFPLVQLETNWCVPVLESARITGLAVEQEEEADESAFWMELIIEGNLLAAAKVDTLLKEANELVAIMAASRISASRRK